MDIIGCHVLCGFKVVNTSERFYSRCCFLCLVRWLSKQGTLEFLKNLVGKHESNILILPVFLTNLVHSWKLQKLCSIPLDMGYNMPIQGHVKGLLPAKFHTNTVISLPLH